MKGYNKKTQYVELTIKRPAGELEVVKTKFATLFPSQFKQIQDGTKNAGRGDVLSFEIIKESVFIPYTKEEIEAQEKEMSFEQYCSPEMINNMSRMGE